jgi:predicted O-linked N-acetylglucosamine transferase (SPINDLY family)
LLKGKPFADATTRALFLSRFGERRVAAERVELVPWEPSGPAHLAYYERVDVALDPFPYNGTTTTCEALWMGVPVVTLRGDRHAGRVGASLLTQIGLMDLIANSVEEYQEIAVALARNPERLDYLRRSCGSETGATAARVTLRCDRARLHGSRSRCIEKVWYVVRNTLTQQRASGVNASINGLSPC